MSTIAPKRKKNSISITIVILAVIGCIIFLFIYKKKTTLTPSSQTENPVQIQVDAAALKTEILSEIESDGEMPDWQKVLWNLDPYNPDTNADGIPDSAEIKENLDPRIVGPDGPVALQQGNSGLIEASSTTSTDGSGNSSDESNSGNQPETETDLVAQEIMEKYIALSGQNGGQLDPDTVNTLVTNLMQSSAFVPQYTIYSSNDLKIEQSNDPQIIRAYGNALEGIVIKNSPQESESELDIVNAAMADLANDTDNGGTVDDSTANDQATAEITQLEPIVNGYTKILNAELALPVPQSATIVHLAFVNSLSEVLYNITNMQKLLTDPVPAMSGVTNYQQSGIDLANALKALGTYFDQEKVIFGQNEAGYPLTQVQ